MIDDMSSCGTAGVFPWPIAFSSLTMVYPMIAPLVASISELGDDPLNTVRAGEGVPVAILHHDNQCFTAFQPKTFAALMKRIEDMKLNTLAASRLQDGQPLIAVSLDER